MSDECRTEMFLKRLCILRSWISIVITAAVDWIVLLGHVTRTNSRRSGSKIHL